MQVMFANSRLIIHDLKGFFLVVFLVMYTTKIPLTIILV